MTAEELVRTSRTYMDTVGALERLAITFAETGIAVIEGVDFSDCNDWKESRRKEREEGVPIPQPTVRKFARWLAKDLNRPLLIAEPWGYYGREFTIKLTIPRLKRNEVLVAQFLLLDEGNNYRWQADSPLAAWRHQNGTNWEIFFSGGKGRKLFDSFLDQCRYDPTFRIALRNNLPRPLPPQVTEEAA